MRRFSDYSTISTVSYTVIFCKGFRRVCYDMSCDCLFGHLPEERYVFLIF